MVTRSPGPTRSFVWKVLRTSTGFTLEEEKALHGTIYDTMISHNLNNMYFSTKDRDNDAEE